MRWLFSKYRISTSLDAVEPLPPSLQQKLTADDELRRFAQGLSALHEALKNSVPEPEAPPALHASIIGAVRRVGRPVPAARKPSIARWLPAPAFAALVCALCVWHFTSARTPSRAVIAHASTALATGGEILRMVPATALGPLTEEWQRLHQDLNNTAEFLLATLP
jgi:hypothetical protein